MPLRWSLLGGLAILVACAGPEKADTKPKQPSAAAVQQQRELEYNRRCFSRSNEHAQAVKTGRYVPPQLQIHRWPTVDVTVKPGAFLKEEALSKQIAKGRVKRAMVIARGGAGKTSLANAMEVSLCDSLRTFLVHLQWDVATKGKTAPNPIHRAMADALGAAPSQPALPFLRAQVGKQQPWLLLLDAFDEVALADRARIVGWVNALQTELPDVRLVVFSRPPVYDETYGLTKIDAIAEIPPLHCTTVDRGIMTGSGGAAAGATFKEFLAKYRLDSRVQRGKGCYYPHMSTWRDVGALQHIAKTAESPALAKQLATRGLQSRAGIYEAYLVTLLQDDVQGTTMSPHDTLELVDALVKRTAKPGTRGLAVRIDDCIAVASGNGPGRQGVCETLLQSALFVPTATKGWWRLANQTLTDLFLARQLHAELPPHGGSGCDILRQRTGLFESSEVGGFLLGMPRGRECLSEVTGVICSHSSMREQQLAEIARNLPPGKAGYTQLMAAIARGKQDSRTPKCAIDTLSALAERMKPASGATTAISP